MTFHESEVGRGEQSDERPSVPIGSFCPTDQELVCDFLTKKDADRDLVFDFIGQLDLNNCDPWDLRKHAKTLENVFYFFSFKHRQYSTFNNTNCVTPSGSWRGWNKDCKIKTKDAGDVVGTKKTFVFYKGSQLQAADSIREVKPAPFVTRSVVSGLRSRKAPSCVPKVEKTDWVMEEYSLAAEARPSQQQLVVCRVWKKSASSKPTAPPNNDSIASNASGDNADDDDLKALLATWDTCDEGDRLGSLMNIMHS